MPRPPMPNLERLHDMLLQQAGVQKDMFAQEMNAKQTQANSIHATLSAMKLGALIRKATKLGISDEDLDEAENSNDAKAAVIQLILPIAEAGATKDVQAAKPLGRNVPEDLKESELDSERTMGSLAMENSEVAWTQRTSIHTASKTYYIGGLPCTCTVKMLKNRFSKYGAIKSAVVKAERNCGYITFDGADALAAVTNHLLEFNLSGSPLDVRMYFPHRVEGRSLMGPTDCSACKSFLWGAWSQGLRCKFCHLILCHECAKSDDCSVKAQRYEIGQLVERRNKGYDWEKGYVTAVEPLMVTFWNDPSASGHEWDEVRVIDDDTACTEFSITNLPSDCTDAQLWCYFSKFGHVRNVTLKEDRTRVNINFLGPNAISAALFTMSGKQLEVKMCTPQADAPAVCFGSIAADDRERNKIAMKLASKGANVKWLISFWRKFGERPKSKQLSRAPWTLQAAPGQWEGRLTRRSSTNEVVRCVVLPETVREQCCFMDLDPRMITRPGKLVSHWQDASFFDNLRCILQDALGLYGPALDYYIDYDFVYPGFQFDAAALRKSYWISTFAINQHVSSCGMCDDCNVVNTGDICSICNTSLSHPCSCGSLKYKAGHPHCQTDKLDMVLGQMEGGLLIALDAKLRTLEQASVLSEIGIAFHMEQRKRLSPITWQMADEIDDIFCSKDGMAVASIRHCQANSQDYKDWILRRIRSTIGINAFDRSLQNQVLPVLRGYALVKLSKQRNSGDFLRSLLEQQADPNAEVVSRKCALHYAARLGHMNVVQELLAAQADSCRQDIDGFSPLMLAAQSGHAAVLQILLTSSQLEMTTNDGATPLLLAAQTGHGSVSQILLAARAKVEHATTNGTTPLLIAAQNGHDPIVQALLAAGADVELANNDGARPLLMAARHGHGSVLRSLIAARADVMRTANDGATAIFVSALGGHVFALQALIAANSDVDLPTKLGHTPLMMAAGCGHDSVLRVLIAASAEIERAAGDGYTPLMLCTRNGHATVVRTLIAAKANFDMSSNSRHTPLLMAACYGHDSVVQVLVEAGAEVERAADDGSTPIKVAACEGHVAVVQALIAAGAEVDPTHEDGISPLFEGAIGGNEQVVALMLATRADAERAFRKGNISKLVKAQTGQEALTRLLDGKVRLGEVDTELMDSDAKVFALGFYFQGSCWGDPKTTWAFNHIAGFVTGHGFNTNGAFLIDGTCVDGESVELLVRNQSGSCKLKMSWKQRRLTGNIQGNDDRFTLSPLTVEAYRMALREWQDSKA